MNESSTQPGTAESERPQHSALAERLLRRHAEPVGVIDVRQPQQLHARTAGWVARRFGLLEHWRTRYGGHELVPPAKGEMVFNAPVAQTREAHGVVPSAHRGDSLATPKETPVSPLLRVTRRPPTLSRVADPVSVSRSPRRFQTVEPASDSGEVAITTDVPQLSQPLISRRGYDQVRTAIENPAGEPGPPVRAHVTESPSRTQAVQTMSARPRSPVTDTNVVERATTSVSAVQSTLARSYELSQPGIVASHAQTWPSPASAVSAPTHASSPAPARETEDQVSVTPQKQKMPTSEAVLPLASAPPTLQRQPLAEQAALTVQSQPLIVTAEIPAAPSHEPPHMIWRKSANGEMTVDRLAPGRTPLPLKIEAASSTPIIARAVVSDSIAESVESARLAYESSGRTREIDVAQLTEHVGRLLSRELEVELERRGMK